MINCRPGTLQSITTIYRREDLLDPNRPKDLRFCTLQSLDLKSTPIVWNQYQVDHTTTLLGCDLLPQDELYLREKGVHLYFAPKNLPYQPFRSQLYTWQELMEGCDENWDNSLDLRIYEHFSVSRFNPDINEALYQRIHDHAIDNALRELIQFDEYGMTNYRCVGIMGGHGVGRNTMNYRRTARTAKLLAENGYLVASGGGPGIMEAANLGAYFGPHSMQDLEKAIDILAQAPVYQHRDFQNRAMDVLERFPEGGESLAIPTWFYGHEPSNLFASFIAKYFSNSIREDTLLAVSLFGTLYAPGSAGTTQEIFMDAAQNHYGTFNFISPMIFLSRDRYEQETMIYPLLRQLAQGQQYANMLFLCNEPEAAVAFIKSHPPIFVGKLEASSPTVFSRPE